MRRRGVTRRTFLRTGLLAATGPIVVPRWARAAGRFASGDPIVAHVHHGRSAIWPDDGSPYRDHVEQDAVDVMLDSAVQMLRGCGVDEAWRGIFSLSDNETRTLGIKVNCNNALDPVDGAGDEIDAIPEPCIAAIRGFVRAGGRSANVTIFDGTNSPPTRYIAEWFRSRVRAAFPDVRFNGSAADDGRGTDAFDPATHVTWDPAHTNVPPETRIYVHARASDYLINVPIVKRHGQANVTLGYKNHLGSIDDAAQFHAWIFNDVPEANVLVDIMGSPTKPGDPNVRSIRERTVLTIGDMLFGQPCRNWGVSPRPWQIFGGEWPGSLIVSEDPVAADSVMLDILQAEPGGGGGCGSIRSWARRYLQIAESKGQGVFETIPLPPGARFDPTLLDYLRIDYRFRELWPSGADLRVSVLETGAVLLEWDHYFEGSLCEVQRATRPDFSDAVTLGVSPVGSYIDTSPDAPAFYRIFLVS